MTAKITSEAGQLASRKLWQAVAWMAVSTVFFGLMAVWIRLASKQLHPFEIAFFRNLFGLVFALPLLVKHGPSLLRTDKLRFYVLRCLIGICSMLAGFWAIVNLPLAQAVALSYATPLFVTIGAVLVLGEVVRARRWTAVLIGFIGVLVILRPGTDFNQGAWIALLSAALSGSVAISIKVLSRTEKPDAIVLFTTLIWVPMSLLPALFVWQWPQGIIWLWIVLAGMFGTLGHLCWTRALRMADASFLTPISFLQMPLVVAAGYWLFAEPMDAWVIAGSLIILAANAYIAHREAQLARRTVSDPQVASEAARDR
ncbi:MAG: DMT family transporter [Xanthomonadales bacterium]|nr:DMT family transporter [Xanthomonadales bacterium]